MSLSAAEPGIGPFIVLPRPAAADRQPLVRLAHIWRLIPIALAFTYAASIPVKHSDLFYTLANGRLMLERGQLPLQGDPFTYAPSVPGAYDQPWLAQVLFLLAERVGGLAGVSLLHAAAVTAAVVVLVWLLGKSVGPGLSAGLAVLALVLAGTNFNIRPQSLAFLPFLLCLALVRTSGPRHVWAIPAVGLVAAFWGNVHGSFALAVLVAGAHLAGSAIDRRSEGLVWHRLKLTLAAAIGTCLNPAGPAVWLYALSIGGNPVVRQNIQEWWPTTALATLTAQLFFATLPLVGLLLAVCRRRLAPAEWLLLLGLGGLAVMTQRGVVWWGLAVPVVLAVALGGGGSQPRPVRELGAVNLGLALALLAIMGLSLPSFRAVNPLLAAELRSGPGGGLLAVDHPTGAVDYLSRVELRPEGSRIFARMEWGGYLAWSLWPRTRVFLDARIERHPPEVWRDYFAILEGRPGWDALLDRYGADYLLLERVAFPELIRQVEDQPGWRRVYQDDLSILYAHAP